MAVFCSNLMHFVLQTDTTPGFSQGIAECLERYFNGHILHDYAK